MKGKVLFDCFWYLEEASSIIQWYKDDVVLNDTTRIAGTSTNFLSVSDIAGSDFGLIPMLCGRFPQQSSCTNRCVKDTDGQHIAVHDPITINTASYMDLFDAFL